MAPCLLLLLASAGCASDPTRLNSERIARMFGNYNIEVIETSENIRVSNLYSEGEDGRVCRTLALVALPPVVAPDFAAVHALITAGASIGAAFKAHGWQVSRRHRYIGEMAPGPEASRITRLMRLQAPAALAVHVYVLVIDKGGRSFDYAEIAELHHPDYLTASRLRRIYGSHYSGEAKRRAASQVLAILVSRLRDPDARKSRPRLARPPIATTLLEPASY